jgi:amino-acid N-acetyltransferase
MLRAGVLQLMSATIRAACTDDLARIEQLLAASALPLVGVREALSGFSIAEENGALLGVVAVENCGDYGLLRSAAVESSARSKGIGRRLVEQAIDNARMHRMKALYLLTTTAEKYFPLFGFQTVLRDSVPESIRSTVEFREACPASATVMKLDLTN